MASKISGSSSNAPASVGAGGAAGNARDAVSGGASSAASTSSPATADVHITDSASQLASLEQTVRSLPAVDSARVAQLQTAIAQGSYTVQPQHVADQLLQLEQALGQLPED